MKKINIAVAATGLSLCVAASGFQSALAEEARFEAEEHVLIMEGEIASSTPDRLRRALDRNPGISEIIMTYVPGSMDDEANLEAARIVRQRGLVTILPTEGLIASGGTDFFLAGVDRIVEHGACVGVHSWSADEMDAPAAQLPKDHEDHKKYLDYYAVVGIDPGFYWYTLEAAPADGMHWMSQAEMNLYRVATKIESPGDGNPPESQPCDDR